MPETKMEECLLYCYTSKIIGNNLNDTVAKLSSLHNVDDKDVLSGIVIGYAFGELDVVPKEELDYLLGNKH